MSRLIYHGSNVSVEHPEIKVAGYYKDFGFGFYCTDLEKQAVRWALTKRPKHIVNEYVLGESDSLKKLVFKEMNSILPSLHWYGSGITSHLTANGH